MDDDYHPMYLDDDRPNQRGNLTDELTFGEALLLNPKRYQPNEAGESSGDESPRGSIHSSGNSDSEDEGIEASRTASNSVHQQQRPLINNVPIIFPGVRNSTHNQLLEGVTNSFTNEKNLLIECPSESDKRLGLLSAAISCMVHLSQNFHEVPTVYYAVDTPREIIPVIKVLKRIFDERSDRTNLNVVVVGFTSNLSVTDYVHRNDDDIERIENFVSRSFNCDVSYPILGNQTEVSITNTFIICLKEFVLSPLLRQDFLFSLERTTVIFEEGHNFEEICCELASLKISAEELKTGSECLRHIVEQVELNELIRPKLNYLACAMGFLSLWVNDKAMESEGPSKIEISDYLCEVGLSHEQLTCNHWDDILYVIMSNYTTQSTRFPNDIKILTKIRKFVTVLEYLFRENRRTNFKMYSLSILCGKPMQNSIALHQNRMKEAVFKMVCCNPGTVFGSFHTASSIIVASKCLAPISIFQQDFEVRFDDTIEISEHEAPDDRFLFRYCSKGPNGRPFSLNFQNRSRPCVMAEVGEAVFQLCQTIPNGVLVVFHSKAMMIKMLKNWKGSSANIMPLMDKIRMVKDVINEFDMTSDETKTKLIADYRRLSKYPQNSKNGALLLALVRGDVYKNTTFNDKELRGIVQVGLPYGSWYNDDRVMSKREYFEEAFPEEYEELNHDWYVKEMIRKVNKTFVGCVPTKSDWGVNVVLDSRVIGIKHELYDDSLLSTWVRTNKKFKHSNDFSCLISRIERIVDARISGESHA